VQAIPYMDASFKKSLAAALSAFKAKEDAELSKNPFGVPFNTGTWGGSGTVAAFAVQMYFLHQAFPAIVGTDETLRGLTTFWAAPGFQRLLCLLRGNGVETRRLRQQPG